MYKAAVIGDRDSILGFKALGIDIFDEKHIKPAEIIAESGREKLCCYFYHGRYSVQD